MAQSLISIYAAIHTHLLNLKDGNNNVIWSEIVIALADDNVEEFKSGSIANVRSLKGSRNRRVQDAAEDLNLVIKKNRNNWHIIENRI